MKRRPSATQRLQHLIRSKLLRWRRCSSDAQVYLYLYALCHTHSAYRWCTHALHTQVKEQGANGGTNNNYIVSMYAPPSFWFTQWSFFDTEEAIYWLPISSIQLVATHTCIQVKPTNKEPIGDGPFVPCREVVLFSKVFFWKVLKDKCIIIV